MDSSLELGGDPTKIQYGHITRQTKTEATVLH